MRRTIVAGMVACMFAAVPAAALAQEEATPTTLTVENTTVERDVTTQTVVSRELDTDDDDDDDDDKTGLWGLAGLLGLLGLAGLARKKRDDYTPTTGTRVQADTTPRGSTSTDH